MRLLKRYPTVTFFILAFVIAWGVRIPMDIASINFPPLGLVAEFGPTIAAFIVAWAVQGRMGTRDLMRRLRLWRINPGWYVLVLIGPAALQLACIGVFVLLGHPGAQFRFSALALPFMLIIGFLLSVGEETGWRGFALPRMQSRFHPVVASLIIGALWSVWHVPGETTLMSNLSLLHVSSTYIAYAWYTAFTMTGSVLMALVFNRTGGSILLMALFHMGLSILWQFVILPEQVGQFDPNDLSIILMAIVVVILVALRGMQPSARRETVRAHAPALPVVADRES